MPPLKKYLPFFILLLVFGIAEWIINPVGEFALNDDFAYARAVYLWDKTKQYQLGGWPAMSLFSHALLGLSFVKLFGFSYMVLRCANMALCLITLFYVYRFFIRFQKPSVSALVCSFIVFNPYYMNLFNSYMTDLTFCNFSFLSFYFLNNYFQSRKYMHLVLFFVFSVLATLVRQIGVVLLLAFVLVSVFEYLKHKKAVPILISFLLFSFGLFILYYYERYLYQKSASGSAYQGLFFSRSPIELDFTVLPRILEKALHIIKFSGSLFVVFFLLFLPSLKQRILFSNKPMLFSVTCFFIVALFFINHSGITGDIVINFGLGIESTIDRLYIGINRNSGSFDFLYYVLFGLFIIGYVLFIAYVSSCKRKPFISLSPSRLFLIFISIGYLILIGIAESSFDRYCIFFALFVLVYLMSDDLIYSKKSFVFSMCLLFLIASFSVLATKDYFTAARLKKKIRIEFIKETGIKDSEINSSAEHQFWDQSDEEVNWVNWDHFNDKKYLVTRGPVSGFTTYKTYIYLRFMPLYTDTFFVLRRNDLIKNLR